MVPLGIEVPDPFCSLYVHSLSLALGDQIRLFHPCGALTP